MTLKIELGQDQLSRVEARAKLLGISVEELARASLLDLVERPDAEFEAAMRRVLVKNRELYGRLR